MSKIGKYLRELSIIALGVAITLSVSVWLSNRSEKRDLALYLKAIKMELEENLSTIDNAMKHFQLEANYEEYLRSHDEQTLNVDTLQHYATSVCYHFAKFQLNTNAFEMFRSSGAMRLVNDKDLLIAIWKAYNRCTSFKEVFDRYFDRKHEHIEKEAPFVKNGILNYTELNYVVPAALYNFYAFPQATAIINAKEEGLEPIKETLSQLERLK